MPRLYSNKYLVLSTLKNTIYSLYYYTISLLVYTNKYGRIYYEIHNIDTLFSFIIPYSKR